MFPLPDTSSQSVGDWGWSATEVTMVLRSELKKRSIGETEEEEGRKIVKENEEMKRQTANGGEETGMEGRSERMDKHGKRKKN